MFYQVSDKTPDRHHVRSLDRRAVAMLTFTNLWPRPHEARAEIHFS
jgi:hypothetical protein